MTCSKKVRIYPLELSQEAQLGREAKAAVPHLGLRPTVQHRIEVGSVQDLPSWGEMGPA